MKPIPEDHCLPGACGCGSSPVSRPLARREFLKALGLGAGALVGATVPIMAGPFTRADFEQLVPRDKKLHPDWVNSLTARGQRETYRGADLEKIGMPVCGLCSGQVYLGGDGKLWHWDIFNKRISTGAEHYAKPLQPASPFEQGFALRLVQDGTTTTRSLDRAHWSDISFTGEYPIGFVSYRDPTSPVTVDLEAFSPFIPLNLDDSSLPVTVMRFTLRNIGSKAVQVELGGWLENAVCLHSAKSRDGQHCNRVVQAKGTLSLQCNAIEAPQPTSSPQPDILFADFESDTYGDWKTTGTAFGSGPIELSRVPDYQGDLHAKGKRAVNSHASAPGAGVGEKDAAIGTLTSPPFTIERKYITFLIGGGAHAQETCMNLLVEDKVVLSSTGQNENRMRPVTWDVRRWIGKAATLQIVDNESGGWGNIGVDAIVFTDVPKEAPGPLADQDDFGEIALALLDSGRSDSGLPAIGKPPLAIFDADRGSGDRSADLSRTGETVPPNLVLRPFGESLIGALSRRLTLKPGRSTTVTFLLAWRFPNLKLNRLPPGRHYVNRFTSVADILHYVRRHFPRLYAQTRLWHDTWYDSTLPYWFLNRTFLNTSILATSTAYRLGNGRFYGWEGVGCCEGTCGHVWQYAHAPARLFPELERITREHVDFGLALQKNGAIHFRGEFNDIPAIDAQAGTILRALREHQTSPDNAFLKRTWPGIRRATEWLIAKDADNDGLIESSQHNTLDTDWFGPVAWLSGLYLAALLAAETMALELDDREFASRCRKIVEAGQRNIVARLFDGEYFINRPDPQHLDAINSGSGCEIDQVMGQSWAFQVGLPRVIPEKETVSALRSLWRYNFTPDVGPYRKAYKPGRWYAMPGEAGLLMCSFPRPDWDYTQARGKGPEWAAGYFNECMNGFEYQAAGHMIWEGLLTEGLAATRAVHDRYHPSRRNPWNEVECGDHYARSMASYGVFLAACGFEYHGPKHHIGFAPRLTPENFRAPFTTAQGWGTYSQKLSRAGIGGTPGTPTAKRPDSRSALSAAALPEFEATLCLKWGTLPLHSLAFALPGNVPGRQVRAWLNSRRIRLSQTVSGRRLLVQFPNGITLNRGQILRIQAS